MRRCHCGGNAHFRRCSCVFIFNQDSGFTSGRLSGWSNIFFRVTLSYRGTRSKICICCAGIAYIANFLMN